MQPILWRISESLLEEQSGPGVAGSQQTMTASASSPLTAELIGLAEDLVLQASTPLHAFLAAYQSFAAGERAHSHRDAAIWKHLGVTDRLLRLTKPMSSAMQCPALSALHRSWHGTGRADTWPQTL